MSSIAKPEQNFFIAVIAIATMAFIFNTTEFLPIGLLPNIAETFAVSITDAGWLITGYAWAVTLLSLPLTIFAGRFDRKILLMGIGLLFCISHMVCSLATDFYILFLGRLGIAAAHAIFWSISIPIVVRLLPRRQDLAMTMVMTGTSLAAILGVPIGTLLGQFFGWRTSFAIIAGMSLLLVLLLIKLLPAVPPRGLIKFNSVKQVLHNGALRMNYLLLLLMLIGNFIIYSYIAPLLTNIGNYPATVISVCLFVNGIAGMIGSLVFPYLHKRKVSNSLIYMLLLLALSFGALELFIHNLPSLLVIAATWGFSLVLLNLLLLKNTLKHAQQTQDIATSIYSAVFNIGIGAGAWAGSLVITHLGLDQLHLFAAVPILVAMLLVYLGRQRIQPTNVEG